MNSHIKLLAAATVMLVLAAAGIGFREEVRYDPVGTQLYALRMKIQAYQTDTGQLPERLEDLLADRGIHGWQGPYVRAADLLDPWHRPIGYVTRHSATLSMAPPNGKPVRTLDVLSQR